jgi:hypothetical protein
MKKTILLSVILFFAGLSMSMGQLAKLNPIPSYNYTMTQQYASFLEQGSGETREKRDMNVVLTTTSDATEDIFATVYIVNKNGARIMGPFTVLCNVPLTVSIPKGKCGVSVTCNYDVTLSVWISDGRSFQ